jgi:DHA2 family multidrug resistance protein
MTIGMAFLFVPINTVVYAGVPSSKNNAVAGIVNLSRNMGGDIGIAMVTTLIARRAQVHQERIATHFVPGVQALSAKVSGIAQALEHAGMSSVQATKQAYAAIYRQLIQQAQTLAYLDTLFVFACFTAVMVPLVLLTKRARGTAAAAH